MNRKKLWWDRPQWTGVLLETSHLQIQQSVKNDDTHSQPGVKRDATNRPHLVNNKSSKQRTIRRGKGQETDLSRLKETLKKPDVSNHKDGTTDEVEVQTLYTPYFF